MRKKLITTTCLLVTTLSLVMFFYRNQLNFYQTPIDFLIFQHAGEVFEESGQLYQRAENYRDAYHPSAAIFKFPPAFQLMIMPLTKGIPAETRHRFIRILLTGMYALSLFLLYRYMATHFQLIREQCIYFSSLLIVVGCWFMPFFESIRWLLAEIPLLLFFIVSFLLLEKGRYSSGAAGILLAYAANAKIYPAFLLAYLLLQKNRAALIGAVAGGLITLLIALWIFGWKEHLFYFQNILPVLLSEEVTEKWVNLNIEKFLFITGVIPEITGNIFQAARLLFVGALASIVFIRSEKLEEDSSLVFSLFITTMFFCFPNYWPQYQIFLIFPIAYLLALYLKENRGLLLTLLLFTILTLFIPDLLWKKSIEWDVARQGLDMEVISREAYRDGTGVTLLKYSFPTWIFYYGYECRALVPVALWLMQAYEFFRKPRKNQAAAIDLVTTS